jgi:hypothetical protein
MQLPTITSAEVQRAAREWKTNGGSGISIVIDDLHAKFTADFCNLVLEQAYGQLVQQYQEAQKPKGIVIAES